MGRFGLAMKTFFKILTDGEVARRVAEVHSGTNVVKIEENLPQPEFSKPVPARSDALTLLETLQREARLIDFLQEDLTTYQDAQVGAAVRDVHRGSRQVLQRCFQIEAIIAAEEGAAFEVDSSKSSAEVRLIGNVIETRPVTGTLVHSGWKVTKCELPQWNGSEHHSKIIAPAEVELT